MQRPVHVLAHVDDGRPTDLLLPEAVSDAGAVIVAADDHARLMFLNRIPPPRMPFNHRTGCGEPRARRWFVHDPKLPRRVAVVFEQSRQPLAVMFAAEWFSFGKRLLLPHRTGKADHADMADFGKGAIQPQRSRWVKRTPCLAELEPVFVLVIAAREEDRRRDGVKLHRTLSWCQLPRFSIR